MSRFPTLSGQVPPRPTRRRASAACQPAGRNGEWGESGVSAVKSIQVEIFDKNYTVQGELDEAYVKGLARVVDEKMRAIAGATGSVDAGRVAVLAALNLADELESYRRERGELQRRVERCVRLVETALKRPA
jgi:cell division protein ZapA